MRSLEEDSAVDYPDSPGSLDMIMMVYHIPNAEDVK